MGGYIGCGAAVESMGCRCFTGIITAPTTVKQTVASAASVAGSAVSVHSRSVINPTASGIAQTVDAFEIASQSTVTHMSDNCLVCPGFR